MKFNWKCMVDEAEPDCHFSISHLLRSRANVPAGIASLPDRFVSRERSLSLSRLDRTAGEYIYRSLAAFTLRTAVAHIVLLLSIVLLLKASEE